MPIDARIPLGVQPVQVQSPFEAMGQIAQLQGLREQTEARRLAADKARQDAADAAQVRRILTETGGDMEKALPLLRQVVPGKALEFETEIAKHRKEHFDALAKETDYKGKRMEAGLSLWSTVKDQQGLEVVRPLLLEIDPKLAGVLPTVYDETAVARIGQMGLSAKERHDAGRENLKLFAEGKIQEALAGQYSLAQNAQEWQAIGKLALTLGAPPEVVAAFGDYSLANVALAAQRGITPEKRETLAATAARDAQAAAHQAATEANAAAQLGISAGNLGVARGNLAVSQAREAREAAANPSGVKLSDTQKTELATMMTVEELANDLVTSGKAAGWAGVGPGAGRIGERVLGVPGTERAATALGGGGKTGVDLRSKIGNIKATIALMRGGTSFTTDEKKLLETYTPTDLDSGAAIEIKIKNLNDFIEMKRANVVRVAQGQFTAPAAGGGGAPTPHRVGDIVTVRGQKVRITKLLPNGKYEAVAVP